MGRLHMTLAVVDDLARRCALVGPSAQIVEPLPHFREMPTGRRTFKWHGVQSQNNDSVSRTVHLAASGGRIDLYRPVMQSLA